MLSPLIWSNSEDKNVHIDVHEAQISANVA